MGAKTQLNHTVNILIPLSLTNVMNDFLTDRKVRGVRPATLTYYKAEIRIFLKWAIEAGTQTLDEINPNILRAYFLYLGTRRNNNGIHKNYTAIRTFLLWAWQEYELSGNCPITKVKIPAPKIEPKPGIPIESVSKLLEVANKRDRAILLLLVDTGIRRRELCALNVGDVSDDTVHLQPDGTKTGKARVAFLSLHTKKALRQYLRERQTVSLDDPLFATKDGRRFGVSGLRGVIRRLCKKAGIPEAGLHDFRRTFALESLRAGADVVSVSRLLGHASVETTKRYLALTDEDLKTVHLKTSPVNFLFKKQSRR